MAATKAKEVFLLNKRDLEVLLALWKSPKTIRNLVAAGFFPSYGCAARRINKLWDVKLLDCLPKKKALNKGRPEKSFETNRQCFTRLIDEGTGREWFDDLVRATKLPPDWAKRVQAGIDLGFGGVVRTSQG
jgi:hypothetical protein